MPSPPTNDAGGAGSAGAGPAGDAPVSRGWKVARIALVTAAAGAALTVLAVWFLLATAPGFAFLWSRVEPRLPEGIEVGSVDGRLLGPLGVTDVRIVSEAAEVRVARIDLTWNAAALLRRTVDVSALEVADIDVRLAPPDPDAPPADPLTLDGLPQVELPFTLRIAEARAMRIRVARPEAGEVPPLGAVVDEIRFERVAYDGALDVGRVSLSAPEGNLALAARLTPRGSYPLDLSATWALTEPFPAEGAVTLTGDLTRLTAGADLVAPAVARLEGVVDDPLERRLIDARLTLEPTASESLRDAWPAAGAWPGVAAGGVVTVRGTPDTLRVVADVEGTSPSTGPVSARGDVTLEPASSALRVRALDVRAGGGTVRAAGSVVLRDDAPELDMEAQWTALRWPLVGEAAVTGIDGRGRVRGTLDAYRLDVASTAEPVDGPVAHARLTGRGSAEALVLDQLEATALGAAAAAHGTIRWTPTPAWSLAVTVRDLDPARVTEAAAMWPGRLTLDGTTSGRSDAGGLHAEIVVNGLEGEVRSEPFSASVDASLRVPTGADGLGPARTRAEVRTFTARWGTNHLSAQGTMADTLDVSLEADLPDIGVLHDAVAGAVTLRAQASGTREAPRAQVDLAARDLVSGETRAAEADLSALVDTGPDGVVAVQGTVLGITAGEQTVDTVRLAVDGTGDAHRIVGRVSAPLGSLDLRASGGLSDATWSGTLEELDPHADPWGAWRLTRESALLVTPDSVQLDEGCWEDQGATACASLLWRTAGDRTAHLTLDGLTLERYAALLPPEWAVDGVARARAEFRIDTTLAVDGLLEADVGAGTLAYPQENGAVRELRITGGTLVASIGGGLGADTQDDPADETPDNRQSGISGLRAHLVTALADASGAEVVNLEGEVSLPGFARLDDPLPDQALLGRLHARVTDFSAVEAANPAIASLDGAFSAEVAVSGIVRSPEFVGEARFAEGRVALADLGITVEDVAFVARGEGLDGVTLDGSLRSGAGTLRLSGEIPTELTEQAPARIRLTGTDFQVVDLPEAVAWISPSLETTITPAGASVTGDVVIPRATIELAELAHTAVRPSADVVFVEDTLAVARAAAGLSLRVRVTLGDSVTFQGLGFSATPRGSLVASDGPGGSLVGTGEITLTGGRYRAYGQDLTIERGRVLFAGGPLDNPGLDVRATRTAREGVVAGLDVAGTLQAPDVTVFSEPAMPQSEALAYIVLGRPLSGASTSEGNLVANAATSLGLRGGNVLASRIGQRFGLSDTRIEADGPLEEAALVAGKYLSPRLYVSYGVGLIEPVSTFRLRYILSSRWTLNAESGRAAGADLLYRIERGLPSP